VCRTVSEFVDIYIQKLQFKIVGSEGVRAFNYRDGSKNDGRTNRRNYSLDLINNQTVMFSTTKLLVRSRITIQRRLSILRNYSTYNTSKDNLIGVLNMSAKKMIESRI